MVVLNIKSLSVNRAYKGRRFKTDDYKNYEKELMLLLPNIEIPKPPYEVYYKFGFSSKLSDWDNPVKPFQDILQKRYDFNDRDIFKAVCEKEIVNKGEEYLIFDIKSLVKKK